MTICAPVIRFENTRLETSAVETTSGAVPYDFSLASIVIVPDEIVAEISVFVNFMFWEVVFPDIVISPVVITFPVFTFPDVTRPPNVRTFAVTFAPALTLTTSSNAKGDAATFKLPIVIESAETLPETVSTLDPYVFTVRFADAADGPIATFEPSSIMLSKVEPPCPPES